MATSEGSSIILPIILGGNHARLNRYEMLCVGGYSVRGSHPVLPEAAPYAIYVLLHIPLNLSHSLRHCVPGRTQILNGSTNARGRKRVGGLKLQDGRRKEVNAVRAII